MAIAASSQEGLRLLDQAGIAFEGREVTVELDMSYLGQTHTVAVPLPGDFSAAGTVLSREGIRSAFEAAYTATFGRILERIGIRVLNLRVAVVGRRRKFDLSLLAPPATVRSRRQSGPSAMYGSTAHGTRPVFTDGWSCRLVQKLPALPFLSSRTPLS